MAEVDVRSFDDRIDLDAVVDLWNLCLPSDPVTRQVFLQKVVLDENLDSRGCLVAEAEGKVVGFVLALLRKFPYGSRGLQPEKGWLSMIFVHPEYRRRGIGTAILEQALKYLKAEGRNVCVMGYSPNYFVPGPDEVAHAGAIEFLKARGFVVKDDAIALAGDLSQISVPEEFVNVRHDLEKEGFRFQFYEDKYALSVLNFVERVAPGGWPVSLRQTLSRGNPQDEVVLCLRGDEVVGYAQVKSPLYDPPFGNPERFGPFAVNPELRGKRIGSVLFFLMVERLRAQGYKCIWLAWAHGDNVRFYQRTGMHITRRHLLLERTL